MSPREPHHQHLSATATLVAITLIFGIVFVTGGIARLIWSPASDTDPTTATVRTLR